LHPASACASHLADIAESLLHVLPLCREGQVADPHARARGERLPLPPGEVPATLLAVAIAAATVATVEGALAAIAIAVTTVATVGVAVATVEGALAALGTHLGGLNQQVAAIQL
jgi:hypothetical protein